MLESLLPLLLIDQFYLDSDEVDGGGQDEEVFLPGGQNTVCGFLGTGVATVDVPILARPEHADAAGGVALRVGVDEQDFFSLGGEHGGEIEGGGRLADATFLVGQGHNFCIQNKVLLRTLS